MYGCMYVCVCVMYVCMYVCVCVCVCMVHVVILLHGIVLVSIYITYIALRYSFWTQAMYNQHFNNLDICCTFIAGVQVCYIGCVVWSCVCDSNCSHILSYLIWYDLLSYLLNWRRMYDVWCVCVCVCVMCVCHIQVLNCRQEVYGAFNFNSHVLFL